LVTRPPTGALGSAAKVASHTPWPGSRRPATGAGGRWRHVAPLGRVCPPIRMMPLCCPSPRLRPLVPCDRGAFSCMYDVSCYCCNAPLRGFPEVGDSGRSAAEPLFFGTHGLLEHSGFLLSPPQLVH